MRHYISTQDVSMVHKEPEQQYSCIVTATPFINLKKLNFAISVSSCSLVILR
jgi:hypothetical protein